MTLYTPGGLSVSFLSGLRLVSVPCCNSRLYSAGYSYRDFEHGVYTSIRIIITAGAYSYIVMFVLIGPTVQNGFSRPPYLHLNPYDFTIYLMFTLPVIFCRLSSGVASMSW